MRSRVQKKVLFVFLLPIMYFISCSNAAIKKQENRKKSAEMRMEVSIEGEQMRERCASRTKFIFIADSYFDKHVEKITFEKFFFTHSNERE